MISHGNAPQVTELKGDKKSKKSKCTDPGDTYTYLASGELRLLNGAAGSYDETTATLSFEWKGTEFSISPEEDGSALDFTIKGKAGKCSYKMEVQEGKALGVKALRRLRH